MRLPGLLHAGDGVLRGFPQRRGAFGLVAIRVKRDAVMLFGFQAKDLGRNMLERPEQLSILVQKKVYVGTLAFDVNVTPLQAVGIGSAIPCGDAVLQTETTRDGQQPHEGRNLFCSLC